MALIDFDVHHGNGSEDIFRGDDRVLMCSIFEQGIYPFTGENAVGPNMLNVGLPSRSGGEAFRTAVTERWLPALEAFAPELIYISAGFDGHREDDMGNLGLVEADYAWVCLLYTSDAADERSSVDLGGRRIINKKKKEENIE